MQFLLIYKHVINFYISMFQVYLARVKGKFPRTASAARDTGDLSHLRPLSSIDLAEFADETEDYELNGFSENAKTTPTPAEQSNNKRTRVEDSLATKCSDVHATNNGSDEIESAGACPGVSAAEQEAIAPPGEGKKWNQNKRNKKKDTFGKGDDINVEDLPPLVRPVLSLETVGQAENVGVLFSVPVCDALEQGGSKRSGVIRSASSAGIQYLHFLF